MRFSRGQGGCRNDIISDNGKSTGVRLRTGHVEVLEQDLIGGYLKMRFGTRVDWVSPEMATTGVWTAGGIHCEPSTGQSEIGEGVTPCWANQVRMVDYRCDGVAYPDTRFDLRFLIKHTMFVRGGYKIPKKGGIKFPTSCGNFAYYGGKSIIGGPKEDEDIGRVSGDSAVSQAGG